MLQMHVCPRLFCYRAFTSLSIFMKFNIIMGCGDRVNPIKIKILNTSFYCFGNTNLLINISLNLSGTRFHPLMNHDVEKWKRNLRHGQDCTSLSREMVHM